METIKIVSVGSGALNALNHMTRYLELENTEYIALDTDPQALILSDAETVIRLQKSSFEESRDKILTALRGATVVFIIVGLGGNTGTNASLLVAECAKEIGAVSIAMVSTPFSTESRARNRRADEGYSKLKAAVNTIIKIPCDKFINIAPPGSSRKDIFYHINEAMRGTIKNLVDMDDFQTTFKKAGEIIFETDEDYPDE